jgi:hypothetical protein
MQIRVQKKKEPYKKYREAIIAAGGIALAFFIFFGPIVTAIESLTG